MTDLAKLVVKLEAQTGKYQRDLDKANTKLDRFARNTKKSVSGIKTAFAGLAFGLVIRKMVQATAKQEQALAQLEQGLKTTGNAAGFTKDQLVGFAEELQKATTFGDEDIISAQSKLLSFTSITGEAFKRTTELALDMSARFGGDLKASVLALGKALNDPIANLGALGRSGIQFSPVQKEMIKGLAETNRLAEAQAIILKELDTQFGGSARAARETFSGALEGLKGAFNDLLESKGGLEDSRLALEEFTELLQDPATVASAHTLMAGIVTAFGVITRSILAATDAARDFGEWMARQISGPAPEVAEINKEIDELTAKLEVLKSGKKSFGNPETMAAIEAEIEGLKKWKATLIDLGQTDEAMPGPKTIANASASVIGAQAPKAVSAPIRDELADARQSDFDAVVAGLRTEEEVLLDSYTRRHEIIMSNTEATEAQKKALIVRLNDETLQEVETSVTSIKENIADESQAEAFDRIFGAGALTSLFSDLDNIEDRFKSLLANIAAQAIASGISNMFAGGGFQAGVGTFIGGLFGGAAAEGGPVSAGKIHLVGEKGPELFMPNVGGSIIPNNKLGGGTTVNINLPNIKDTDTFRKSSGQIASEYRREIARAGRNQ